MNGGFLGSLVQVLNAMLSLFSLLLVAYAMISWVRPDLNNSVVRFLRSMVEPVLTPVRKVLPPRGGVDFSVLAVLFVIYLLRAALASY